MRRASPRAFVALAGLAALAAPGLVAADTTVCVVRQRVIERKDGWTELRALPFDGLGTDEVAGYAASPSDPNLVYVTNGFIVLRSPDGGCQWQEVWRSGRFVVDQLPVTPLASRVADLAVPARDPRGVTLLVSVTTPAGTMPRVLTSHDRGDTWAESVAGLPVAGRPELLALGLQTGIAYASVRVDDALGPSRTDVYRTADDGTTWSRTGPLPGGAPATALRVDPLVGTRLWAVSGGRLLRSDDAGSTFAPVADVPGPVGGLAAAPVAGTSRIVAGHAERPFVWFSDDGGSTWQGRYALHAGRSVAAAAKRPLLAVAGPVGASLIATDSATMSDVSPGVALDLVSFSEPSGRSPVLYGRTVRGLMRYLVDRPEERPERPSVPVDIGEVPEVVTHPPTLLPRSVTVTLRVGERRTLDYVLDLPPTPTPLDVMFVVDTTGSMQPVIDGLRGGIGAIVEDLAGLGVDARFGVAEFKDYPGQGYGADGDVPYRLLRAIGPADRELEDAIERLEAAGGGDGPESGLVALHQMVTGAGETYAGRQVVPPGADAGFRAGSLRVAVVATDTTFHDEAGYPGPDFADVVTELRGAGVRVVGLATSTGGHEDLRRLADETGTYAPAEGVDCDGDHEADVPAGEPLVCDIGGLIPDPAGEPEPGRVSLAPAVSALLRALRDETTVALVAAGAPVVTVLAPGAYPRTNVKAANVLDFRVEVACPEQVRGRTVRAGLGAVRRGETVARAGLTVACQAAPAAPVPLAFVPVARPPRPPVAAAVVPPPPPPPAPATNLQPQPNPQPNPQVQPNPQAGLAAQENEQAQVALADSGVRYDDELAMSALARAEPGPETVLLAAAVAACAAAGSVAAARSRAQRA